MKYIKTDHIKKKGKKKKSCMSKHKRQKRHFDQSSFNAQKLFNKVAFII